LNWQQIIAFLNVQIEALPKKIGGQRVLPDPLRVSHGATLPGLWTADPRRARAGENGVAKTRRGYV